MSISIQQSHDNNRYIVLKFAGNYVQISFLAPYNTNICWEEVYLKVKAEEKKWSSLGYQCEIDKALLVRCMTQINHSKSIFNRLKQRIFNRKQASKASNYF